MPIYDVSEIFGFENDIYRKDRFSFYLFEKRGPSPHGFVQGLKEMLLF